MERQFNFAAGPSAMPLPVLEQIRDEMLCYPGAGSSVLEMSHRSSAFQEIHTNAQESLRRLMRIPEEYAVLFLQGGASLQFSMIPMNLMPKGGIADYVETGSFAKKAAVEAARWGTVNTIFSGKAEKYSHIPEITEDMLSKDASYLHITGNNTIYGTRYIELPDTGAVPLVADASSNILSEPMDVSRFGVLFAGTQKNIGPAGMAIVLVRRCTGGTALPTLAGVLVFGLLQYLATL